MLFWHRIVSVIKGINQSIFEDGGLGVELREDLADHDVHGCGAAVAVEGVGVVEGADRLHDFFGQILSEACPSFVADIDDVVLLPNSRTSSMSSPGIFKISRIV